MATRSLHIGIDYVGTGSELHGCVNDAENISEYLVSRGLVDASNSVILREAKCSDILRALFSLAAETTRENVSNVFISFSGHGTYITDYSGDELDGRDECICPSDYATAGVLRDDEMNDIFSFFNKDTSITLLMDCCHSGSCMDLPYRYLSRTSVVQECSGDCHPRLTMISGCADQQTSADAYDEGRREYTGAMTSSLLDSLKVEPELLKDAFGLLTCMRVLLVERKMTQVPQLSTSAPATSTAPFFSVLP